MTPQKTIIVFLVVVFSAQLLPLQQVGFLLSHDQFREELNLGNDATPDSIFIPYSRSQFFASIDDKSAFISGIPSGSNSVFDIEFLSRSSDDVRTPPPNSRFGPCC
jgi:hypothetical protein